MLLLEDERRVSVVGPFRPSDIAGLVLWLRAEDISGLSDGDPVVTWSDQSTQSNDVTQGTAAKRPTFRTSVVNGKAIVRFDGTDDVLVNSSPSGLVTGAGEQTIIVVTSKATAGSGERAFGYGILPRAAGRELALFLDTNTPEESIAWEAHRWGVASTTSGFVMYTIIVPVGAVNTDDVELERNGASLTEVTIAGTVQTLNLGADAVAVGARHDNGFNIYEGDIAEIICYDSDLRGSDLDDLETYINDEYGITIL